MRKNNILLFNESASDGTRLRELIEKEDFRVFETSRVLEALHILKSEEVDMVLAARTFDGVERVEFEELVEKTRPGTVLVFLDVSNCDEGDISIAPGEFMKLVCNSMTREKSLEQELKGLREFFFDFADRLLQIFEVNDKFFFNNDHLVADMSKKMAMRMGLDEEHIYAVQMAALLRDIGKVAIQKQLLEDSKRLNQQELMPIKHHPLNTVYILKQLKFPWKVDSIIAQHHEHYDGRGYPRGIKGREISLGARIVAIADTFYAMTMDRPYRGAMSKDKVVQELRAKAGSQFDPELVEVAIAVINEDLLEVGKKHSLLVLERKPDITAMVKLSLDASEVGVMRAENTIDAMRYARLRNPELIIADVEMLEKATFLKFYNVLKEMPSIQGKPFFFIIPHNNYPRDFKGPNLHYISRPLNMDILMPRISSAMKSPPPPIQQKEFRGLVGDLKEFSLFDIIQILKIGLKTAKVAVQQNGATGTIYIEHGSLVHASMGKASGTESLFEMFKWNNGEFNILHGQTTKKVNIMKDTMHILLEAAQAMDGKATSPEAFSRGRGN